MTDPEINSLGSCIMFAFCPTRAGYGTIATLSALAISACSDPGQRTDLRPDGPPEVLAVLVMTDAANGLLETATYCRKGDDKRPSLVGLPDGTTQQVCPADGSEVKDAVDDAYPKGWFVRIMFDELLDPSVEDLVPIPNDDTGAVAGTIARTKPVILQCTGVSGAMVDIPYDGYYSPAGNNVTWPLGPSLVIAPKFPGTVPTQATCQISLNDVVHDKNDGELVPLDERGPYGFSVAPIRVTSISPGDGDEIDGVDAGMDVLFNTVIDTSSIDDAVTWAFDPGLGTTPVIGALAAPVGAANTTLNINLSAAPANGFFDGSDSAAFGCGSNIALVCNQSNTTACTDSSQCGSGDACETTKSADCDTTLFINDEQMHLTHVDFLVSKWTVTRGENATIAAAHPADSLVLAAVNNTASSGDGRDFFVSGDFRSGTGYTWTIPEGTIIKDRCGIATTFGPPSVEDNTQVQFTVHELAFTGITPTDGTMAANPGSKIQLKFNQPMNPDSLSGRCSSSTTKHCFTNDDCSSGTCQGAKFTLTPAIGVPDVRQDPADPSQLDIYGNYQLGTQYVFTIPAGTQIAECPGGETLDVSNGCDVGSPAEFTVAEAKTVTFTTAAAIALTGFGPDDNAMDLGAGTSIRLTFNQEMDFTTLVQGASGFDITPSVSMIAGPGGSFRDLTVTPTAASGFAAGTYTFTLHAGAQVADFLGNMYVQPSDLTIHFTIAEPQPPAPECVR